MDGAAPYQLVVTVPTALFIVQALVFLAVTESMWWLMLSVAAGPALIAWLNRRAEFRADAYAAGLGFGDELVEVLDAEHRARSLPPAFPQGTGRTAFRGSLRTPRPCRTLLRPAEPDRTPPVWSCGRRTRTWKPDSDTCAAA